MNRLLNLTFSCNSITQNRILWVKWPISVGAAANSFFFFLKKRSSLFTVKVAYWSHLEHQPNGWLHETCTDTLWSWRKSLCPKDHPGEGLHSRASTRLRKGSAAPAPSSDGNWDVCHQVWAFGIQVYLFGFLLSGKDGSFRLPVTLI